MSAYPHRPLTPDRQGVADFVASCDAGLNARIAGENFGLAIAEFLAQDKPVLVWGADATATTLPWLATPA